MGDTYLCDQFGVQSLANNNSCQGALYHQRFVDAQKLCQFDIEPIREKIYSLQGNQFLLYLDEALTVPISCTLVILPLVGQPQPHPTHTNTVDNKSALLPNNSCPRQKYVTYMNTLIQPN